jgi:hypothetical protein
MVQSDQVSTNNLVHWFHGASSAVDLGGGFIGVKFNHGAAFTPTSGMAFPFDGSSVTALFAFNLESVSSTQMICSVRHLDGSGVGVGENIECYGQVVK